MHIFIISALLYTITKADDSDSKYIDLLPEKEKQVFLEKIARRILEEVQTKDDRPRASSEIPDEQLNEHDAFVKKIMNEESKNLRRQSNNKDVKSNQNKNIGRILSNKEDKNKQHVDLTLSVDNNRAKRESSRKVFTGFAPDDDNSTYHDNKESDVDIQAKNFKTMNNPEDDTDILEKTETASSIDNNANNNETEKKLFLYKSREIITIQDQNLKEATLEYSADQQDTTTQDNLNSGHNISFYKNFSFEDPKFEKESTTDNQQTPIRNRLEPESTTEDSSHKLLKNETEFHPAQLDEIQRTYVNKTDYDSEKLKENTQAVLSVTKTPETTKSKTTNSALRSSNTIYILDIKPNKTITKEINDSDVINIQITKVQDTEDTTQSDNNINKNLEVIDGATTTTEKLQVLTTTTSINTDLSLIRFNKEKDTKHDTVPKRKRLKLRKKPKELKKKLYSALKSTESKNYANIEALRLKLLDKNNKNENNIYYKSANYSRMKPVVHEVFEICKYLMNIVFIATAIQVYKFIVDISKFVCVCSVNEIQNPCVYYLFYD